MLSLDKLVLHSAANDDVGNRLRSWQRVCLRGRCNGHFANEVLVNRTREVTVTARTLPCLVSAARSRLTRCSHHSVTSGGPILLQRTVDLPFTYTRGMASYTASRCSLGRLCIPFLSLLLILLILQRGDSVATASGTDDIGPRPDHLRTARPSVVTFGKSSIVVASTSSTEYPKYPTTPLPVKPIVYAADERYRVSKPKIDHQHFIEYYKQTLRDQTPPTPAAAQRRKPPIGRQCQPCAAERSFARRTSCAAKPRSVVVRVGYCFRRFDTLLCYGDCASYSETHLERTRGNVRLYNVKHACSSCQAMPGLEYKTEVLECPGFKRTYVRIPLERTCSCRPCRGFY